MAFPSLKTPPGAQTVPYGRLIVGALLVLWFVAGLAYLGFRHYLWPRLDDWRPVLVERLSALAGRPVSIGRVTTGFEGLLPRLTVDEISVEDDDGTPALRVPRASAVLSPRTLLAGEIRLATLLLESAFIRVERRAADAFRIGGVDIDLTRPSDGAWLEALLTHRRILLKGATVEWIDRMADARERVGPVELAVGTVGRRHRASVSVGERAGAWQRLNLALQVYRPPGSRPAQWERWAGELYAGAQALDLARLGADSGGPIRGLPDSGVADFKAWMDFDQGQVRGAQLKAAARALEWRAGSAPIAVESVEAEATLSATDHAHDLRVQRLAAIMPDGAAFAALGEQRVVFDRQWAPVSGRLATGPFDAGEAVALARRLPLGAEMAERLQALAVQGRIASLSARWSDAQALTYEAAVDFEQLSLRYGRASRGGPDAQRMPWFENLSGQARVTHRAGELRVDSRRSTLAFPGVFPEPEILFDSLKAAARWSVDGEGDQRVVAVDVGELRFSNADAEGVVSGTYRTGGKGAGIVDLSGRLDRADAKRTVRYLPLAIPQTVRDWVGSAVSAGRSDDVRLRLRGDLADFPFRRAQDGEFSVKARLVDTTLAYAPGWPAIERFDGSLDFERAGMRVAMKTGRVFDVALGETEAVIADFKDPLLRVRGSGAGPAAGMIRFVNQSPLATRIDDFTRDTSARGNAKLGLRLDLPLDHLDQTRVAGSVTFLGNDLTLDSTVPPLAGVAGVLEFTERGMALRGITAGFLGGPLRVDGETPEPGHFSLRAEGSLTAEAMRTVSDNVLTRALSGQASFQARVEVRRRAATVQIESDLQGLAAALPHPFAKAADERWPLRVRTTPATPADPDARPSRDAIRVDLRDGIRLALERERDPKSEKLLIRRGAFAMDAEPVLPATGLAVTLNIPRIDVDAWMGLLSRGDLREVHDRAAGEFAEGFSLLPDAVSVVAKQVHAGGRDLNDVVLGASRIGGYWQANIAAREVNGFFSWREAGTGQRIGTLTARFTRLEVPRSRVGEVESLLDTPPDALPALDIAAEEFVLFDRRLGTLALRATNSRGAERPEWTLNELRILNPAASFRARGTWAPFAAGPGRATRLDFELGLVDAGALLSVYGLENVVRGGSGTIAGDLSWVGSPMALDYGTLGGTMSMKIGKGQFLKTEPGIAKLIGVLNLQSLPRRLTLDFRDVFAEGFAFDEISGEVGIERGVARTDNLLMRGVQAQVKIRGSANIAAETQKLEVEVRPELNAGLASIAYGAMVNPVIGIGSFVAQLALRSPIQQMFSYEYEISGPWADPQVIEKRRRAAPAQTPVTTP